MSSKILHKEIEQITEDLIDNLESLNPDSALKELMYLLSLIKAYLICLDAETKQSNKLKESK